MQNINTSIKLFMKKVEDNNFSYAVMDEIGGVLFFCLV